MTQKYNLYKSWEDSFPVDECKKGVSVATIIYPKGASVAEDFAQEELVKKGCICFI